MKKAIVVYGTVTGHTKEMAEVVKNHLTANYDVEFIEVKDFTAEQLTEYDLIVLGTPTWGTGELPEEYHEFYKNLIEIDLTGKDAAVFGLGDTAYGEAFCQGVHDFETRLKKVGAKLIQESFTWDGPVTEQGKTQIAKWTVKL